MDIPIKTMRMTLRSMMESLYDAFFPEYSPNSYEYSVNEAVQALSSLCGTEKAELFRKRIPFLAELLAQDVEAIGGNDPAASDTQEIVYCYPAVTAMVHYRVAHELDALGIGVIPRMLTEYAHSETGIDIHPQAKIGHHFAIDHGTGVVIGQTAVIGNRVTLYQGVTRTTSPFTAMLPSWEGSQSGKVPSSEVTYGSRTASRPTRESFREGARKSSWTAPAFEITRDRDCPTVG